MINSSPWQPPRRGKCPVVDRPSVPAWSRGRSWRRGYGVPLSCSRRQVRRQGPTELTISQFSALATVVRACPARRRPTRRGRSTALTSGDTPRRQARRGRPRLPPAQPWPDRRGVLLAATDAGRGLIARREQASNAWLAERLQALPKADRLCLERAARVLESLAAERPTGKEVPG